MALQTVNLGPNPFGTVNNAPVPWTGAALLDAALVAAGATGYMALFGPDGTVFRMTVASQGDRRNRRRPGPERRFRGKSHRIYP